MSMRAVVLGCLVGVSGYWGIQSLNAKKSSRSVELGTALQKMGNLVENSAFAKTAFTSAAVDRLVLIKSLYFFVNGGAAGTWPSGEHGELTGYNAPSEALAKGYLGVVNDVMGPEGAVAKYLVEEGYDSCSKLPTTDTEFSVDDELLGELTVTVGASTRAIPDGLTNSGKFEHRIELATASDTVAVVHLHCSTQIMTMLMRLNIEFDTPGQVENLEAVMEGSELGPDVHLQFITQNKTDGGDDMAIEFKTEDGDTYSIFVAYSSNADDANGNGPAHVLAGVTGTKSTNKANLAAMGGNTDVTAVTSSLDLSALPFNASQTFATMAAGNKFCIDTTDASDTTGCPDLAEPGDIAVSGLASWTMSSIYAIRQETANVAAISTY